MTATALATLPRSAVPEPVEGAELYATLHDAEDAIADLTGRGAVADHGLRAYLGPEGWGVADTAMDPVAWWTGEGWVE